MQAARKQPAQLELADFAGCWLVSGERFAAACFEPERGFLESKTGAWDAFPLSWTRVSRALFASDVPALGAQLGVGSIERAGRTQLELRSAESRSALAVVAGLALTRPSQAERRRLAQAVSALPEVHRFCESARGCVARVNALLAAPSAVEIEPPPLIVVAITDQDSLLQCREGKAHALEIAKLRKLAPPAECR